MEQTLPISTTIEFADGSYGVMYQSATYGDVIIILLLVTLVAIEAVRLWRH